MKTITGKEFLSAIEENPDFFNTLTEPLEITDPCHIKKSPVRGLSQYLIFKKSNEQQVLFIENCPNLKFISSTFETPPFIANCPQLESIQLHSENPDKEGVALYIMDCLQLKQLSGKINGSLKLEKIKDLNLEELTITPTSGPYDIYLKETKGIKMPLSVRSEKIEGDAEEKSKHKEKIARYKRMLLKEEEEIEI